MVLIGSQLNHWKVGKVALLINPHTAKKFNNFVISEPKGRYNEGEVNIHYKTPVRREEKEFIPEDELRKRQEDQMRKFYEDIEHKKEQELLQDMQNRKHHDTLLPTQKSPIPLNR